MRAATVKVLQWISVTPVLVMVRCQDWIHLRNVRAPILIEVSVVLPHRAVRVLIVAEAQNEIGFGRLGLGCGADRRGFLLVNIANRSHPHDRPGRRWRSRLLAGSTAKLDGASNQRQTNRNNERDFLVSRL